MALVQRSSRAVALTVWRILRSCATSSVGWNPIPSLEWTLFVTRRWNDLASSHRRLISMNTHTSICCLRCVIRLIVPDGEQSDNNIFQTSWERSLVVFDSRISCLSREESAPLRLRRQIVVEALSDFNDRLPGESPPTLSTLLAFADGREKGSKYPNFMLASERCAYGL